MGRIRLTLFVRLMITLAAVAALPTAIVTAVQERALVEDLEEAAGARLDRARHAADGLIDRHLEAQRERYRVISGTPQLRATLELNDSATLTYYAEDLAKREGAASITLFAGARAIASGGSAPEITRGAGGAHEPLIAFEGGLYSQVRVAVGPPAQLGALVAAEPVDAALLAEWSDTCGALVSFGTGPPSGDTLTRPLREIGGATLTVQASLDAERRALAHARRNLMAAGGAALAVAILASIGLSRGWVRPILQVQRAADQIGRGNFESRINSRRTDEIGDVARAFDQMSGRLGRLHGEVASQQVALESKVRELDTSREHLRNAQRMARMGSWRFESAEGVVLVSDELQQILGMPPSEGRFPAKELAGLVHSDDHDALTDALRTSIERSEPLDMDHRVVLADGRELILRVQAHGMEDEEGLLVIEGTAQDVTERKRAEEQIRFLAYHDALTGLGNRRLFQERVEQAIAESQRTGAKFGVLFFGLDHFKRVNDTLGHSIGDQLLRDLAERLAATVREADAIARGDLPSALSRFAGDEFSILIGPVSDALDLAKVANRLLRALTAPFVVDGNELVLTASIGIATWPDDGDDPATLLRNADAAMFHAKQSGRVRYQYYSNAMNEAAVERLAIEQRLRRALELGELDVHYQPKLSSDGTRVLGVEALARWDDAELGRVSPADFVAIAEETGLIDTLGAFVLRRSCEDCLAWNGGELPGVPVSVNLSAHQFREGQVVDKVETVLRETGLPATLLEIEITESALLHDEDAVVSALESLRARGVQVALDDFGTGYSSLSYLNRLPIAALKLDRSFVRDISSEPSHLETVKAVLNMAHSRGLKVIAEGIETVEQLAKLQALRCDFGQGYYFSTPMDVYAVERTLAQYDARRKSA